MVLPLWRDFALLRTAQGARASNNKSFTTLTRRALHFAGSDAGSTVMPDRMTALPSYGFANALGTPFSKTHKNKNILIPQCPQSIGGDLIQNLLHGIPFIVKDPGWVAG